MQLEVIEQSDTLTEVALEGQLDIEGVNQIENAFTFNTATPRKPTIVDMSRVSFIASLGMGMLVTVAQSLRRHGVGMVILNPTTGVAEALRLANLEEVIPIATSREDALAKLL